MTPARPERNRPSPRRRSFFALVWPVGLLLALAAAWSGYWYAGSLAAREAFERWQQRQGDAGRQFTCAEQSFGGYPFRFEMYCTGPRLQAGPQEGSVAVHAKAMRTVSMAYAPGKVIAEFDAPMYVELEDGSAVEAGWESARMSMRVTADAQLRAKITRADLAVEAPLVNLISGPGRTFAAYTARAFQAHTRETEVTGRYDTALSAVAPELRFADGSVHRAERVDVVAAVSAVQSLRRGTWRQRLAAWRDAGGQLDLAALRLELPQALAVADGRLRLDALGRPEGTLNLTSAGLDISRLTGSDDALSGLAVFSIGALGTPVDLEGRKASRIGFQLREGTLFLGPLGLTTLPSLTRR